MDLKELNIFYYINNIHRCTWIHGINSIKICISTCVCIICVNRQTLLDWIVNFLFRIFALIFIGVIVYIIFWCSIQYLVWLGNHCSLSFEK